MLIEEEMDVHKFGSFLFGSLHSPVNLERIMMTKGKVMWMWVWMTLHCL